MTFHQNDDDGSLVLAELEPFFVHLLLQIPGSADPGGHPEASARIFSAPTADGGEAEFQGDWREYVEPELRHLFRTAQEVVIADLKALPDPADSTNFADVSLATLSVPREHAEAWLSTLNQARLIIAAKHHIGEPEMKADLSFPPGSERDFAAFQIHFYEMLQHLFLRSLGFA